MVAYDRLLAEGTCSSEYRFRVADGGYRWFEDLAQMVHSPDGKRDYIVGVLIDIGERKRAEELAQAQEDRFRLMVENSADMVMLLDTEGKLRYVSASHKRILGFDPAEVLGIDVFELIHPEDRPALQESFARRAGIPGRPNGVRLRTLHKDGSWRVVEATAQNLFHVPAIAAIVINARDVTNRVLAEEALRASESRYRTLAEAAEEAIFIIDRNRQFLYVNNFMAARWGVAQEELIGQSLTRLFDPDTVEKQHRILGQVLATGESLYVELRIETTRGVLWTGTRLAPLYDDSGEIYAALGISRDITAQKQAEESLREREELLTAILESMNEGVFVLDENYRYTYVNRAMVLLTGVANETVLADVRLPWEQFPHMVEQGADVMMRKAMAGETIRGEEMPYLLPDGTEGYVTRTYRPLRGSEGEIRGMVGVVRDVTENRRRQEAFYRQQRLATVGQLAAGIAHDFNNVLTPILLYAEFGADMTPDGSQLQTNLKEIVAAAVRAKGLVAQILTFGRQETSHAARPINLQPVIQESLRLVRASLPSTIEIVPSIDQHCRAVMADPTEIHQIVMNLCTNAFYVMRDTGGVLRVTYRPVTVDAALAATGSNLHEGCYVCLTVADTGSGMGQDVLAHIFEPFFTTKPPGEGSGMGLSVVYGITRGLGGDILVASTPGQGSVFSIYLPELGADDDTPVETVATPPRGNERILVVDDEEAITHIAGEVLRSLGYSVRVVGGSIDALQLVHDEPDGFDLVLTDFTMPTMTGLELAERLLQIRPNLPMVLMTGYRETVSHETIASIGIRDLLVKPFSIDALSRMTRRVLGEGHDPA